MDDPRPLLPAEQRPDRAALAKPVGERPIRMAGGGMDDQAGRLIDHREPLVLVHHHEIHDRRGRRWRRDDGGGDADLDLVVAPDPLSRTSGAAVDPDGTGRDQGVSGVAGDPALPRQPDVEAGVVVDLRGHAGYSEVTLSLRNPSWYTTTSMPPTIAMSATLKIWNSQKWKSMKSTT